MYITLPPYIESAGTRSASTVEARLSISDENAALRDSFQQGKLEGLPKVELSPPKRNVCRSWSQLRFSVAKGEPIFPSGLIKSLSVRLRSLGTWLFVSPARVSLYAVLKK